MLHVEDDSDDAQFVARVFEKAGYEVAWTRAQAEAEYRSALAATPQAVIADYSLPQFSGLQALEILKQTAPDVPFILVTGTIGEERAAEIMRLGASDYLLKERLARLPVAVERAVREAEQRVADRKAKAEAEAGLRRLNRVYAVLSAINSAIVRIRDRQELLDECCRIAVEIGRFVAAWIGMVSGDATVVTPVASAGAVRDVVDAVPLGLDSERSGYRHAIGIAIRSKVTVVANSLEEDASKFVSSALREAGIQAFALIPLTIGGRAVGILGLYAADAGFFVEEEMRLLGELTGDISFALDHMEKAEKLDYLSYYDPVTGAPNRSLFHERLKLQLDDAARDTTKLALLIMDVERFKTINDTLGRHAGDVLLREIVARTDRVRDPASWFARLGADHFALVVPDISEEELARRIEKRLDEVFSAPYPVGDTEVTVSARVGVAVFPADGSDADTLFRNAEAALKRAKATGERYLFYAREMTERVAERLSLESKLRKALEREEFVLHYQPKIQLDRMDIVGVEALIRWRSPDLGLVPPMKFVPLLEETGLILQVGAWALARAVLDHRAWVGAGLRAPRIAVNVSPAQLRQRDFVAVVEQTVVHGRDPTFIDLEITESLIMTDVEGNIEKLNALRALGMSVAIDDFGTGYSSLAYLAKLPVQALKIDRAFIHSMLDDADALTLAQTIISMGHSLRLTVIAEGVETAEQAKMLRLLHCDEMQGFVFSKPLPHEELVAMLK